MRISDWSSDVCSSDLAGFESLCDSRAGQQQRDGEPCENQRHVPFWDGGHPADIGCGHAVLPVQQHLRGGRNKVAVVGDPGAPAFALRSEAHTSELQSLMRISFDVFCLKKKNDYHTL